MNNGSNSPGPLLVAASVIGFSFGEIERTGAEVGCTVKVGRLLMMAALAAAGLAELVGRSPGTGCASRRRSLEQPRPDLRHPVAAAGQVPGAVLLGATLSLP